jgi:hypothetical protein
MQESRRVKGGMNTPHGSTCIYLIIALYNKFMNSLRYFAVNYYLIITTHTNHGASD